MYVEKYDDSDYSRQHYKNSLFELCQTRKNLKKKDSVNRIRNVLENQEQNRLELRKMLGSPLCDAYPETPPKGKMEFLGCRDEARIYRVCIKMEENIPFYGLLFVKSESKKAPFVIFQHGANGTPERAAGILEDGSTNYNDVVKRILGNGANVFLPQLYLWDITEFDSHNDFRSKIDATLKQTGSSIAAYEIFFIMRAIDYLCEMDVVDSERIAMAGLSYGGFFTLYTMALDERIKCGISCSFYNDRLIYNNRSDWIWFDSGGRFTDNEIVSLIYPRGIDLYVGDSDKVFDAEFATAEFSILKEVCETKEWAKLTIFEGSHEFFKDDKAIKNLMKNLS